MHLSKTRSALRNVHITTLDDDGHSIPNASLRQRDRNLDTPTWKEQGVHEKSSRKFFLRVIRFELTTPSPFLNV